MFSNTVLDSALILWVFFNGNLFLLSFSRTILAPDFSGFSHLTMCQPCLLNYCMLQWANEWNLWWHLMLLSGINLAIHEVQAVQEVDNTSKVLLVKLFAPTLPAHRHLQVWFMDTSFSTVGIAQCSAFAVCLLSINPHISHRPLVWFKNMHTSNWH